MSALVSFELMRADNDNVSTEFNLALILFDKKAVSDFFKYGANIDAVSAIFNFNSKPSTLAAKSANGTVQN